MIKTQTKYLSPVIACSYQNEARDHFKVPLTDHNRPDYERFYFAFGAVFYLALSSTVGER